MKHSKGYTLIQKIKLGILITIVILVLGILAHTNIKVIKLEKELKETRVELKETEEQLDLLTIDIDGLINITKDI